MGTKKTPEKKSTPRTKGDTPKRKVSEKKSSVVKKELAPLTASEAKKTEKQSVTLLKEAINTAKTKALANEVVAKPIKKAERKLDKPKKIKTTLAKSDVVAKETYTKSDIVKPKENTKSVILEKVVDIKIDDNIKPENTPATNNSIYTKESILSVLNKENNLEDKGDVLKESIKNLQEKIKAKQEEELDKNSNFETKNTINYFRENTAPSSPKTEDTRLDIDRKPTIPPNYSYNKYIKAEKKDKKKPFILILGVILVIAGASFGIFKFVINKENAGNIPVNAYVEVEEIVEVTEEPTTDAEGIITELTTEEQAGITEDAIEQEVLTQETPKVVEEAPKVNEIETPPTPVAPTPPVAPPTPTAPSIEAPTMKKPTKPYRIAWKDTLQSIAINELGDKRRWPTIYNLNKDSLNSPDSYTFGTTLSIPIDKKQVENMNETEKASLYNDYLVTIEAYKKNNDTGMVIVLERIAATLK